MKARTKNMCVLGSKKLLFDAEAIGCYKVLP
jgi:hypothetical protein